MFYFSSVSYFFGGAAPRPFRRTPHEDRGPHGSSTEGPRSALRPSTDFEAPLTRTVAPMGVPPKAPVAGSARRPRAHFGAPHHEDRGPHGSSTEGPNGRVCAAAPRPFRPPPPPPSASSPSPSASPCSLSPPPLLIIFLLHYLLPALLAMLALLLGILIGLRLFPLIRSPSCFKGGGGGRRAAKRGGRKREEEEEEEEGEEEEEDELDEMAHRF